MTTVVRELSFVRSRASLAISQIRNHLFIVPLAIPAIAGPSAPATMLLLASRPPDRIVEWRLALIVAIVLSTLVLAFGRHITNWLGQRGVMACERLMGLLLPAIAVEMLLAGIEEFVRHLRQIP